MTELVYQGGGDLTFHDGTGARRRVQRGATFEVDAATARILLRDPAVIPAGDLPRGNPADEAAAAQASTSPAAPADGAVPTKKELRARTDALGLSLPSRATNEQLAAAIAAEETRLADEAAAAQASSSGEGDQGGEGTPADDPAASATGEAGPPPETPGAVTLGDLPASAIKQG